VKIYISGPITGNDNAEDEFSDAYIRLHNLGHNPVSPIDIGRELEKKLKRKPTWAEYMKADIKALMDCDAIYMLKGWEKSSGARLEEHMAMMTGIKRIEL